MPVLVVATVVVPGGDLGQFAGVVALDVEHLAVVLDVDNFVTLNRPEDSAAAFVVFADS